MVAPDESTFAASAVTGKGIDQLRGALAATVAAARDELAPDESYVVHRPVPEGIRIERGLDGAFEVIGREARRAVAFNDMTNPDALDEAHRRLSSLGVNRALARAGCRNGDVVRIGDLEFAYEGGDELNVETGSNWS